MKTCENCGRTIGNLETPCFHQNHAVCAECQQQLQRQDAVKAPPLVPPSPAGQAKVRKKKQIFTAMSCLGTVLLLMGLLMESQAAEDFHLQTTGEIGGIMAFIGGAGLIGGILGFVVARLQE
jgi:hypothetical protein